MHLLVVSRQDLVRVIYRREKRSKSFAEKRTPSLKHECVTTLEYHLPENRTLVGPGEEKSDLNVRSAVSWATTVKHV